MVDRGIRMGQLILWAIHRSDSALREKNLQTVLSLENNR